MINSCFNLALLAPTALLSHVAIMLCCFDHRLKSAYLSVLSVSHVFLWPPTNRLSWNPQPTGKKKKIKNQNVIIKLLTWHFYRCMFNAQCHCLWTKHNLRLRGDQLLLYLCCHMVVMNGSEQCIKEWVGLNNSEAGRLELYGFILYFIPSLPFIALIQLKLQHVKLMSSFSHRSFKVTWFCSSGLPLIPLAKPHSGHFNMGWTDRKCTNNILIISLSWAVHRNNDSQHPSLSVAENETTWASITCNVSRSII